jgi:transcriptional regulator with XRE-family HTH domain
MNERELLKVLGINIRQNRTRLGWSQAELAEKVNISINFLSDIETGKKWASPVTMVKLAGIFNIEAYELLRPLNVLPDTISGIMEKYKEDIHHAIDTVHSTYLAEIHKANP